MFTRRSAPPFDVRNLSPNYCRENDVVEAGYDTINRMVIFIGDIPFHRLFTTRWEELFPELIAAIDTARRYDLIRDADVVEESFERLQELGKISWQSHVNGEHPDTEAEIRAIHVDLWRQGIHFPFLRGCRATDALVQRSLNALLEHDEASRLTYRNLFEPISLSPGSLKVVRPIVRQAVQASVVAVPPNQKCCSSGECVPGLAKQNCTGSPCSDLTSDACNEPGAPESSQPKPTTTAKA